MGRLAACGLTLGTVVGGQQAAGQPHVSSKGVGILLVQRRLAGFPAKATNACLLVQVVPDSVELATHRASGLRLKRSVLLQVAVVDSLQQSKPDHWRCYAQ
ncbi:hypothetical protein D3C81_1377050 [compost metagenome]